MNRNELNRAILTAAVAGILAGGSLLPASARTQVSDSPSLVSTVAQTDHNSCSGKDGCSGKQGEKSACSGKDGCSGKQGEKSACSGKDGCSGKQGEKSACSGKDGCSGKQH
jgi:hypothetical protein